MLDVVSLFQKQKVWIEEIGGTLEICEYIHVGGSSYNFLAYRRSLVTDQPKVHTCCIIHGLLVHRIDTHTCALSKIAIHVALMRLRLPIYLPLQFEPNVGTQSPLIDATYRVKSKPHIMSH